jgi:hypothetical protein
MSGIEDVRVSMMVDPAPDGEVVIVKNEPNDDVFAAVPYSEVYEQTTTELHLTRKRLQESNSLVSYLENQVRFLKNVDNVKEAKILELDDVVKQLEFEKVKRTALENELRRLIFDNDELSYDNNFLLKTSESLLAENAALVEREKSALERESVALIQLQSLQSLQLPLPTPEERQARIAERDARFQNMSLSDALKLAGSRYR